MDLPIIAPMSKWFDSIRILHLEPTDVCQAACPLCAREVDDKFDKTSHNNLTLDKIVEVFPESSIAKLDKMFMCGNYGDPAASNYSLSIYKGFRKINPGIVLGMNTNGGLQNNQWWEELAGILNRPEDYVVFSIDGLEFTNDIYRKNVKWSKVMSNAQSFINAGGHAHWDMLVYPYNQHQVAEAENLAKTMGFKWFRSKISKRPTEIVEFKPLRKLYIDQGSIDCYRDNDQSLFISAQGKVYPCCWLGPYEGELSKFDDIRLTWNTDQCNPICKRTCTKKDGKTSFNDQWQLEVEF
jgi:sulfatase maturation enzyme AslB (radical SAM superfamily)